MTNGEPAEREGYHFKTEITQLLDILIHSLYKERDIFLRELVSNASDALTRIQFEMLTNQDVRDAEVELAVHIHVEEDGETKKLVVRDSGIGMNRDEITRNLGTIAQSGAKEFLKLVQEDENSAADVIGQFGVGFYSVFMVADEVRVVSASHRPEDRPVAWVSRGGERFWIEDTEKDQRGTAIHITLKPDAADFANEYTLRQTVKRYSDFVAYPIYVGEEQANQQRPLWRKPPAEVTDDERVQFYQQLTMDFEEPLADIHLTSDAPLHVRSLLFVPASGERNLLNLRQEPGLKLYAHNVLIQEYCTDLLPKWLDFVDGVVESEDLPLNVSRETIQNAPVIRRLGRTLRRRVVKELDALAENDAAKYELFWDSYSRQLKEGLASDPGAKDEILPLLRFYSSQSQDELTSLEDYLGRMLPEQEEMYYVLGESAETVALSPHLDPFRERGLEVLFLIDAIDPFITPLLSEYKDKKLRNVDDASIDLPDADDTESSESQEEVVPDADFNRFIGRCVTTLGDRVVEVRESRVLRSSPVRLVAPEDAPAHDMDRLQRFFDKEYEVPKRILEVNRGHNLIAHLTRLVGQHPQDQLIELSINQLYENALVMEGLHPNPAAMLPQIQKLLEIATEQAIEPAVE
ncbi:MAG: molecular chaperone HtpG [Chloroflexota bacterium]|nr:MAG: molecular chaperone HtpG [Chloroflexota bacterium]